MNNGKLLFNILTENEKYIGLIHILNKKNDLKNFWFDEWSLIKIKPKVPDWYKIEMCFLK
jgi:hypothetical protein